MNEEHFKNKTDQMIENFIEDCEKKAAKLEVTVDYYIKEFVVDFPQSINYTTQVLNTKKDMTKLWRIEELTTEGWTLLDDRAVKLTKEKCDIMLEEFLATGVNANRMRAVPDVGQPYKTPDA